MCRAIVRHALLHCVVPRRAMSRRAVPRCPMLCCAVPCSATPHPNVGAHGPVPPLPQVRVTSEEVAPLHLANLAGTRTAIEGSRFAATRELVFSDFHTLPRDVYFWVLPSSFTGDKVPQQGQGDCWVPPSPAEPCPCAGDVVWGRAEVHGDTPCTGRCPAAAAPARCPAARQWDLPQVLF